MSVYDEAGLAARIVDLEQSLLEAIEVIDDLDTYESPRVQQIARWRAVVGRKLEHGSSKWTRSTPAKVALKVMENAQTGPLVLASPQRTTMLIAAAVNGARIRMGIECAAAAVAEGSDIVIGTQHISIVQQLIRERIRTLVRETT